MTSRISPWCATLVWSTHGLVSAFFHVGRQFGASRPNTLACGLRKRPWSFLMGVTIVTPNSPAPLFNVHHCSKSAAGVTSRAESVSLHPRRGASRLLGCAERMGQTRRERWMKRSGCPPPREARASSIVYIITTHRNKHNLL